MRTGSDRRNSYIKNEALSLKNKQEVVISLDHETIGDEHNIIQILDNFQRLVSIKLLRKPINGLYHLADEIFSYLSKIYYGNGNFCLVKLVKRWVD